MNNFESELARLAREAGRLADLFARIADDLESRDGATVNVQLSDAAKAAASIAPSAAMHTELPATAAPSAPAAPPAAADPAPVSAAFAEAAPAAAGAVPPWEAQAAEQKAADAAPKPEKKSGRRTNEELAADAGVSLDDVKNWLGDGVRVTKKAIEEYAELRASAAMDNQTLDESASDPAPAPAAEVPAVAANPFGGVPAQPVAPAPAPTAAPAEAPAAPAPTTPAANPVAEASTQTPTAPPWAGQPEQTEGQFEAWPTADFDPNKPF